MDVTEFQRQSRQNDTRGLDRREALTDAALGLCGESGEVADLVKKHLFQGHPLDRERMLEELGDVAWYLVEACSAMDIDMSEVLRRNMEKLAKRYPHGFSVERSLHREDECE